MTGPATPLELLRRAQTSIDRAISGLLPRAARWIARDCTDDDFVSRRLLVLAPHPDDETLSCGMTIQRTLRSGGEVTVVVATDGRYGDPRVAPERMAAVRRDEVRRATAVLGLDPSSLVMLDFEDATLSSDEDRLAELLRKIVVATRPEVVVAPCPWDLHPDHAALGRTARRILVGRPVKHLEYLVWGWDQPLRLCARLVRQARYSRGLRPHLVRPVLVGGAGYEEKKAQAIACHSSQFAPTAVLYGRSIDGTGPLGNEFLHRYGYGGELFFPRDPG